MTDACDGVAPAGVTPDGNLAADRLAALPPRLLRRARALAETLTPVSPAEGDTVTVGSDTVMVSTLTCTCLLSPRCAHVGAVCLGLVPAADPTTSEVPGVVPQKPVRTPDRPPAVKVDQELVDTVREQLAEVLRHGLVDLPLHHAAALAASLQQVRVHGLHRLERELTGVVRAADDLREGRTVNRATVTGSVTGALLTCHRLRRGDAEAVGTARRVYHDLGSVTLVPVGAQPVFTDSGFAGASVIFAGPQGQRLGLGRTPPGGRDAIARIWNGSVGLGDIRSSLSTLARHRVLVSGATVSADGRLGSGKGVRAALGPEVTATDVREAWPGVLVGQLRSVSRKGVELDCGSGVFSRAARVRGVDGIVATLKQAMMQKMTVQIVTDDRQIIAVWTDEVVFPGLDRVTDPGVSESGPAEDGADVLPLGAVVDAGELTPTVLLREYLELLVFGGPGMLRAASLGKDADWCERNGAPLAARLLRDLTAEVDSVLPAVAYG